MYSLSPNNNTFQSTAPVITLASFSFPLTFLYFALATLASISIGRVLYFKHKFLSFQGGFLSLSLVWSLLRAVMMLFTDLVQNKAPAVYRLLEWAPEVFQLATFSLLVVFFGSIEDEEVTVDASIRLTLLKRSTPNSARDTPNMFSGDRTFPNITAPAKMIAKRRATSNTEKCTSATFSVTIKLRTYST